MTPDQEKLREEFAALEHARWSRWHKYAAANWTPERVARWNSLAETPYEELTEELKQKDRDEIEPYYQYFDKILFKVEAQSYERGLEAGAKVADNAIECIEHTAARITYASKSPIEIAKAIRALKTQPADGEAS